MRKQALLSLFLVGVLASCTVDPTPPVKPPGPQVAGLVELTFTGLGGSQPLTAVRAWSPGGRGWSALSLTNQAAGLQLEPLTLTVFNTGTRGVDGMRYVSASYRVRNAGSDGTPSTRARSNLTLIAVSAGDTLEGTAFRAVTTFGGGAVKAGVVRTILPTHAMQFSPVQVKPVLSAGAEDLQVYTESEVAPGALLPEGGGAGLSYTDLGVNTVFPYGFVVHTLAGGRTLAANPAANNFEGRVTFSVKLPLQPDDTSQVPTVPGNKLDPWAFRVVLLVVEDSATRVTQSLEEQGLGNSLVAARASAVGASLVNILPGSTYPTGVVGGVTARCVTQVRTAGLAGDPGAAYLVNGGGCP